MLSETPVGGAAILDALPLAVLLIGQDGCVVQANPAAEELFGTSAAVLAKIGLNGIISPFTSLIAMVEQARQNEQTMFEHGVELDLLRGVGPRLVDVRATPLAQKPELVVLSLARAVRRGLATTTGKHNESIGRNDESEFDERLSLIGHAPAMQDIYRTLARLKSNDLTVMIVGESGTGKELIARALHEYGKRRAGPFVAINMAAIPRELIESDLFGHEKGAFTGAVTRKEGRFEQADGGTLFLDEVGDMPLEAQTSLLRVLEEGEFISVGGIKPRRKNVRIIAATHRNLRQMVAQGLFRKDLFFRLNVVPIRVPPLRERKDDIALLMRHFLLRSMNEGLPGTRISAPAMQRLKMHDWPGNVRELENLARRLVILHNDEIIESDAIEKELAETKSHPVSKESEGALRAARAPGDDNLGLAVERQLSEYFAAHEGALPPEGLYDRVVREVERPLLTVSLEATGGNQLKAAKMLGINRNTLRKKIRDLDIRVIRGVRQDIDGIE